MLDWKLRICSFKSLVFTRKRVWSWKFGCNPNFSKKDHKHFLCIFTEIMKLFDEIKITAKSMCKTFPLQVIIQINFHDSFFLIRYLCWNSIVFRKFKNLWEFETELLIAWDHQFELMKNSLLDFVEQNI